MNLPRDADDETSSDLSKTQSEMYVSGTTGANKFLDYRADDADLKRRALTGAGATVGGQTFKFVLKFGSAVILGRLLGPADFGIIAMVAPIIGFISTLNDLGFAQAVVQHQDITHVQVSGLFWISVLFSTLLAGLLMFAAPMIGLIYHEPRTVNVTIVLASLIVVGTFGLVPNALLSRQMRFLPLVIIDAGCLATSVISTIIFAWLGFSYWALVIGQAISSLIGAVSTWAFVGWWPKAPRRRSDVRHLVKFGANLAVVNLATYFNTTADNMIVGVFAGKVPLGLYDRSYTLVVQPVSQLMAPIGRVAVPLLSRLNDEPDRFRTAFTHMLSLSAMLTAPAMICCFIMPKSAILLLLGAKWVAAAPIFGWICFGGIFSSSFSSAGWVLTTQGRTHAQMVLSVSAALIGIASFAVGIHWGVVGVAMLAALAFSFIQLPLMLWGVTRTGCIGAVHVAKVMLPIVGAGFMTAVSVLLLDTKPFSGNLFFAAALCYAVFIFFIMILPGGKGLRTSFRRLLVHLPPMTRFSSYD